ncbi:excalibur calcium-binding domain-containing protein [Moraxella sp. ZY200743]
MVALGTAWAYREYIKDNEYIDLETKARRDSLGLWSQPDAIYPSDFRRGKRGEQTTPVQTQQIAQSQEKRDLADSGGKCGSKRTCKQMSSCAEAKHYLNVCGLSRLDRDGDGIPCETLCK